MIRSRRIQAARASSQRIFAFVDSCCSEINQFDRSSCTFSLTPLDSNQVILLPLSQKINKEKKSSKRQRNNKIQMKDNAKRATQTMKAL